jgi:hypothetical protein
MIESIKHLQEALAYARFEDEEIKRAAEKLLSELDRELTTEDYEEGPEVESARVVLFDALEATDTQREEKAAAASSTEEDEDPFAGLGDEEEEK